MENNNRKKVTPKKPQVQKITRTLQREWNFCEYWLIP